VYGSNSVTTRSVAIFHVHLAGCVLVYAHFIVDQMSQMEALQTSAEEVTAQC
jgi:hypothetical protein